MQSGGCRRGVWGGGGADPFIYFRPLGVGAPARKCALVSPCLHEMALAEIVEDVVTVGEVVGLVGFAEELVNFAL